MRIFGNWNNHKVYPYKLVTGAAALAVSLVEIKAFLKLDASDTSEDAFLTILIESAVDYAEKYTRRDLINKTYITYRDDFEDLTTLRKSKLQSITHIKYYDVANILQTVSSGVYAITDEVDYSDIYRLTTQLWPTGGVYNRPQAVQITFVSGYGAASSNLPSAFRNALMNHIAHLYANRGDCATAEGCASCGAPSNAMLVYKQYKIRDIIGRTENY